MGGMKTLRELALQEIDAFLDEHKMTDTTLGRLAVNDGHAVFDLRNGGNLTLGRVEKLRAFMRDYRPSTDGKSRPKRATDNTVAA